MEIINYSEEHKIFRDSLRKFLDKEVVLTFEEWEEAGIVPRSVWKKMGEQGFLCTSVPEEYGGLAADFSIPSSSPKRRRKVVSQV